MTINPSIIIRPRPPIIEHKFTPWLPIPWIGGLSPQIAGPGVSITLTGGYFDTTQGSGTITMSYNGTTWGGPQNQLNIIGWTANAITFAVPDAISGGAVASLTVTNSEGYTSQPVNLSMLGIPIAASLSRTSATPNMPVTISGTDFGPLQLGGYLSFSNNGINWGAPGNAAGFQIIEWTDTQITFVVPVPSGVNGEWAVTFGTSATVTVTNAAGLVSAPLSLQVTTDVSWPVTHDSGKVEIGTSGNGYARTTVTITQDGTVTAVTTVSDSSALGFLTGFTAGVAIVVYGPYGNLLAAFQNKFGCQGGQTNVSTWTNMLTAEELEQVYQVGVQEEYDPKDTGAAISDWLTQISNDYNLVKPILTEVGTIIAGA